MPGHNSGESQTRINFWEGNKIRIYLSKSEDKLTLNSTNNSISKN